MKKPALLIIATALVYGATAQVTIDRQVVASSGYTGTASGVTVDYTIGEMAAVTTLQSGNIMLTQGFQQYYDINTGITETAENVNVSVFPNPASDILNISPSKNIGPFTAQLFDLAGNLVLSNHISDGQGPAQLNLLPFASGSYLLRLQGAQGNFVASYRVELINTK